MSANRIPAGSRFALLTQHGKATAFEPAVQRLGGQLVLATGFDTDTLGSFTGERERTLSAADAAQTKARLATELSGARFGLGSEGSYGPDPQVGLLPWGVEIVCCWDAERGQAVHALAQGPQPVYRQQQFTDLHDALDWARALGFPQQGLIVGQPGLAVFDKTVSDEATLRSRLIEALAHGPVGLAADMRAHRSPARMAMISQAADALATRLQSACPGCGLPGYGPVRLQAGAICSGCGRPTATARAEVWACAGCGHSHERPLRASVDPSRCEFCNP
ncbi:MAG: hypothetical protein C0460_15915 [Methylibium sp.]|jgi:hypothetical protein|nr:hypothetical protein [Methylibium sp.]